MANPPLKPLGPGFNSPPEAPSAPVDPATAESEDGDGHSEETARPEVVASTARVMGDEAPQGPAEVEQKAEPPTSAQGTPDVSTETALKAKDNEGSDKVTSTDSTTEDQSEGEPNDWAEEAERAVARAQEAGTPEAWQEVAQAATVVSEMAQTMRVVADTSKAADQMEQASQEAAQRAQVAAQTAAAADLTVRQTAKAAEEAADAAKVAAQKAADAEQKAEQAAQAVPMVSEAAKAAAKDADEAKRKVKAAEEIVAKAREVNTPAAWSAALDQVTEIGAADPDDAASDPGPARGWSAGRFNEGSTGR